MRLFTALRFPETTLQQIGEVENIFSAQDAAARFVPLENFHLTLVFIGEVPDDILSREALAEACAQYKTEGGAPLSLRFSGTGTFHGKGGAILWLGIEPEPAVTRLVSLIKTALRARGVPFDDKAFNPHITLARKYKGDAKLPIPLPEPITISEAALVWSHRVNDKLTYEDIALEAL